MREIGNDNRFGPPGRAPARAIAATAITPLTLPSNKIIVTHLIPRDGRNMTMPLRKPVRSRLLVGFSLD
jgi:hypothetical protein